MKQNIILKAPHTKCSLPLNTKCSLPLNTKCSLPQNTKCSLPLNTKCSLPQNIHQVLFCSSQERSLSASEEDPDSLINDLANNIVTYCEEDKVNDPVEILRYFQKVMVEGRALRIQESGRMEEGETNFILVDRLNILETALEEVKSLTNLRKTLEVQFYGEVSFTGKCNILPFNL